MPDWHAYVSKHLSNQQLRGEMEVLITEEIAAHLEDTFQAALASGCSDDEARARAEAEVADWDKLVREISSAYRGAATSKLGCRLERTEAALQEVGGRWSLVAYLLQDLRLTMRRLRKARVYTGIAVATLALGIGGATAVFSVVNGVLLRPLPYPEPDRLVNVWQVNRQWLDSPDLVLQSRAAELPASPPLLRDWDELLTSLMSVGGYDTPLFTLHDQSRPERIRGARVTSGVWRALQVAPLLGRTFVPADDEIGAQPVAVLSHRFWQRRFAGAPSVVGMSLQLDGTSYSIVGVMPPGFYFPSADCSLLWTTISDEEKAEGRGSDYLDVIARLEPGTSLRQAQHEIEQVTEQLIEHRGHSRDFGIRLVPRLQQVAGSVRLILLVLLGCVAVVQLIAIVNLTNMLLARAAERQRELACCSALGASRCRLLCQPLLEAMVLSVVGGFAGFLLAGATLKLLLAMLPQELPRIEEIALDYRVLLFCVAISLLTGLLAGALPGLRAAQVEISAALRDAGRGLLGGARRHRTQGLLVVSEIALAFVLLIGAGLLVESLVRLTSVERGFNAEQVLAFDLVIPSRQAPAQADAASTDGRQRLSARQQQLLLTVGRIEERIAAIPGVTSVATADCLPFLSGAGTTTFSYQSARGIRAGWAERSAVTPAYFQALGIPIISGRGFSTHDDSGAAPVVVVSRELARQYWPDQDPIGQRLQTGSMVDNAPWRTVVGVAEDVRHHGLDVAPRAKLYRPFAQLPFGPLRSRFRFVLKTATPDEATIGAVRNAIAGLDPYQPLPSIHKLEHVVYQSVAAPRFRTRLVSLFAVLATILAVIGIYGVLVHVIVQRIPEIGVRKTLGASKADIVRLVLARGTMLAAVGIAIGGAISAVAVKVLDRYLFETSAHNPLTFLGVALLLAMAALSASVLPAFQAGKVDPNEALRAG
jgi:putative ABC transport system permease protein